MGVHPWQEIEITLTSADAYTNPYVEAEVWADFVHENTGTVLRRPAFWDGGHLWKIRFASPALVGEWRWQSSGTVADSGLVARSGSLTIEPSSEPAENSFYRHGFWKMSPRKRNLVHADGTSALIIADTAWGLPWRATEAQCKLYAQDRHAKGFNAALMMSIQPDMKARGPRDRTADNGFDVGFEDLPTGHINQLNPAYFQYFDRLIDIMIEHEIVPVLQPVFHGFGWKGLGAAGGIVPPGEYARYCRYLVARFGARPTIYLIGADGSGYESQIAAGGEEIELWDAYQQPTGIHYRPHSDNRAHQSANWLDFQWCQTGHRGEHIPERVADMWRNAPAKGVANGEPSYEHSGIRGKAEGWWQGHEAWSNLCAGGTMGVFYGAASLWQWRLSPTEAGHEAYFLAEGAGWREALDFEGSRYVGLVGQILKGLTITDMEPDWKETLGGRGLLIPGELFIAYVETGGDLRMVGDKAPLQYRVVDPRNGEVVREGARASHTEPIPDEGGSPRVYICYKV